MSPCNYGVPARRALVVGDGEGRRLRLRRSSRRTAGAAYLAGIARRSAALRAHGSRIGTARRLVTRARVRVGVTPTGSGAESVSRHASTPARRARSRSLKHHRRDRGNPPEEAAATRTTGRRPTKRRSAPTLRTIAVADSAKRRPLVRERRPACHRLAASSYENVAAELRRVLVKAAGDPQARARRFAAGGRGHQVLRRISSAPAADLASAAASYASRPPPPAMSLSCSPRRRPRRSPRRSAAPRRFGARAVHASRRRIVGSNLGARRRRTPN